jgi:MATE family multidrug resistance protein
MAATSLVSADRRLTHRDVAVVALPITLSNATTPLVGFVDTAVIGQLGEAHLIGGVAIAANIFNALYWGFGFLRMGTTGLTAQAAGAADSTEVAANLFRALLVAGLAGALIVIFQAHIAHGALWFMGASPAVEVAARGYYDMRIWAAPAGLANFALLGWFIGLGRAGVAFWLQIVLNLLNVALAILFVLGLGWGVAGAGLAALISEWSAALLGFALAFRELKARAAAAGRAAILDIARLKKMFAVNRDIMIRTFCALGAFLFFTAQSAQTDDVTLAANAVLMSLASIAVYLLDGFAFAAETLVGQAIGAGTRERFREAVALSTIWAGGFGLVTTAVLWLSGPAVIDMMTASEDVRAAARIYLFWAALTPIVGVWCFQLDGIFIGATRTADMRNMMILSLILYIAAWAVLKPAFANHGLWAAIHVFYVVRALTLLTRFPALERGAFR